MIKRSSDVALRTATLPKELGKGRQLLQLAPDVERELILRRLAEVYEAYGNETPAKEALDIHRFSLSSRGLPPANTRQAVEAQLNALFGGV